MARRRKPQSTFQFPPGWGGARPGSGPKPRGGRRGVRHRTRDRVDPHAPLHVTLRLRSGLPSLRRRRELAVVVEALAAGREADGFRLAQFSVQTNHLHLIVEADDARALTLGVQGLMIRIAKRLNAAWRRKGKVFADRYHARALRSPREVRNALEYVLNNAVRHGARVPDGLPDPCSSGLWFDGWRGLRIATSGPPPVASARSWLLRVGWRRQGTIPPGEKRSIGRDR